MSSAKWRLFRLSLNVLSHKQLGKHGCVLRTVAADVYQKNIILLQLNIQQYLLIQK